MSKKKSPHFICVVRAVKNILEELAKLVHHNQIYKCNGKKHVKLVLKHLFVKQLNLYSSSIKKKKVKLFYHKHEKM